MAEDKVNQVEESGPSTVQPPVHPADHNSDGIEPVASSSKAVGRPDENPQPRAREPSQPLRFVESSASSSGDEIAPCDDQGTPTPFKKTRHGKFAYSDRYDASEYIIEQLSEYDDIDMVKSWHRKLILIHPIVIVWVFITYAAYYGYRVWCNYQYRLVYGGLDEASWIFICVEGVIMCKHSFDNTYRLIEAYGKDSAISVMDGSSIAIARQPQTAETSLAWRSSTNS